MDPFKIPTIRSGKLMLQATLGKLLIMIKAGGHLNFLAPEAKGKP